MIKFLKKLFGIGGRIAEDERQFKRTSLKQFKGTDIQLDLPASRAIAYPMSLLMMALRILALGLRRGEVRKRIANCEKR
ncbi:MAG: hypothetical protein CMO55_10080 [Verrucomicrobiales bacterium]|nr:hypothetical protein [Verrucomicrobiales bacterium]